MTLDTRASVRSLTLFLAAALGLTARVDAQQWKALPQDYVGVDLSFDGAIVVGWKGSDSFLWRWSQEAAPTLIPGGTVVATSDDGSVLAGNCKDPITNQWIASIWTVANGWQSLGTVSSGSCQLFPYAMDISGDGSCVVGHTESLCGAIRAFRWTAATGVQLLNDLAGHDFCQSISRDGSIMGGHAGNSLAYWKPDLTGSMPVPGQTGGAVRGFDNKGTRSIGTIGYPFGSPFHRDHQTGVLTIIGQVLFGWVTSMAFDISEDGNVIAGSDFGAEGSLSTSVGWVWTSSDGTRTLQSRLQGLGAVNVPYFASCRAVSDDGRVILATAGQGSGLHYIVELPSLVPFGSGTAGCSGASTLRAKPFPKVNTPTFNLTTTNVPASSLGIAVVTDAVDVNGSYALGLGVKSHVDLFASTEAISFNAPSDAAGTGVALAPIPNSSFLTGKTYYAQSFWLWPSSSCQLGPFQLSSSTGLAITIHP